MRRGTEYFPRVIQHPSDLPFAVQEALENHLSHEAIRRLIVLPSQKYHMWEDRKWWRTLIIGHRMTPPRTLAFLDDQMVIVEGEGEADLAVIPIPASALVMIRLVSVLLYSYLEFTWINQVEQIGTIRIEYNSVGSYLIERELNRLRSTVELPVPLSELVPDARKVSQPLPLKFRNFIHDSLLPGETIHATIYEPAIRQPGIHLNPFLSPNRVIVLTDQNVIVIEDAHPRAVNSIAAMYQYERCFCPRNHVIDVLFEAGPDVTWVQFQLGTAQVQHEMRIPLSPTHAAALQTAWSTHHYPANA